MAFIPYLAKSEKAHSLRFWHAVQQKIMQRALWKKLCILRAMYLSDPPKFHMNKSCVLCFINFENWFPYEIALF